MIKGNSAGSQRGRAKLAAFHKAEKLEDNDTLEKVAKLENIEKKEKRKRYGIVIEESLLEKVRDAAWAERQSINEILVRGVRAELERMEAERGKPYDQRGGDLPPGRPMK